MGRRRSSTALPRGETAGARGVVRGVGRGLRPGAAAIPAAAHRSVVAALRERVKELTCLYGITQLAASEETVLDEVIAGVVRLLPPAWQYPEVTRARIVFDDRVFATPLQGAAVDVQRAEVLAAGKSRGHVEVAYLEPRAQLDEGPFLKEERNLIDAVARHVGLIVERRETAQERARLQAQLRHADRLATIGQLAAGFAHELSEPLGAVLGFAQLARKARRLPAGIAGDIDKIVAAGLHAREIVKKLMLFARQTPPAKTSLDLNQVVRRGLVIVEDRCGKQGVEVVAELDPALPRIVADASQLQQLLVNLAVNAVQAMPDGGTLSIRTTRADNEVLLVVADTGTGMSEAVMQQIFLPFFTTKDVDQGTGLGLSVVHGIVAAHHGSIAVTSQVGRGCRFEVRLPVDGREDSDGATR
jgi:two-component system, NtrC family, sensor kinase